MSVGAKYTIVGVFPDRLDAQNAVEELRSRGFRSDQIGAISRKGDAISEDINIADTDESHSAEGAAMGALAGAGVGALVGLGVLSGVIPVIGPAIAAGTLGTIISNAAGGAAVAGLAGALVGWGVPEAEARYYESELHEGRTVVTVHADHDPEEARDILRKHGGYDMSTAAEKSYSTSSRSTPT